MRSAVEDLPLPGFPESVIMCLRSMLRFYYERSELENLSRHFDGPPSFKMSALAPTTTFSILLVYHMRLAVSLRNRKLRRKFAIVASAPLLIFLVSK